MLQPRLTNCVECTEIPVLLTDIDCKLTELAKNLYNNTVYVLNRNTNTEAISDLLQYKRILTYRKFNSDWANCYTTDKIASRVKLLIKK